MPEPEAICLYEKREPHIAIIRLNRPEKKNAISRDLYWALDEAWQKAKSDDDVWSVILTGSGDAFCVGGDLKENLAFAKGEMKGPRSGPRPYSFALSGQMIEADTAFRLGLVQKLCEPDKLIDDCIELCTTINRNGRLIAAHTIEYIEDKLLYEIQGWEKGFEVHREFYAHLRQSKDYDEGSAAFAERRKPEFSQEYYDKKTKPPGVP